MASSANDTFLIVSINPNALYNEYIVPLSEITSEERAILIRMKKRGYSAPRENTTNPEEIEEFLLQGCLETGTTGMKDWYDEVFQKNTHHKWYAFGKWAKYLQGYDSVANTCVFSSYD